MKSITLLEIKNIKLAKINQKFNVNRRTGTLFANKDYIAFKETVFRHSIKPLDFDYNKPFIVEICLDTPGDIDASIKPILDGLCMKLGMDDKYIKCLHVYKNEIKRTIKKKTECLKINLLY